VARALRRAACLPAPRLALRDSRHACLQVCAHHHEVASRHRTHTLPTLTHRPLVWSATVAHVGSFRRWLRLCVRNRSAASRRAVYCRHVAWLRCYDRRAPFGRGNWAFTSLRRHLVVLGPGARATPGRTHARCQRRGERTPGWALLHRQPIDAHRHAYTCTDVPWRLLCSVVLAPRASRGCQRRHLARRPRPRKASPKPCLPLVTLSSQVTRANAPPRPRSNGCGITGRICQ
jgi:hypothetical protein